MIRFYDLRMDRQTIMEQLEGRMTGGDEQTLVTVRSILADVKERGDDALVEYTCRFDWPTATRAGLAVPVDEIQAAYADVEPELLATIRESAKNIEEFHKQQLREGYMIGEAGRRTGQLIRPLQRVGVYVPGGRAAYPSSVLMNVIPAKVAGVKEIVMTTPAGQDGKIPPLVLVAANEAGVTEVHRVGGAQAIGALAYGTDSIRRVDKIVGPGNIYVALAKREVYGTVGIDMIAGPSEILVIADKRANPKFIAADMLSQAEHDPMSSAFLITDSTEIVTAVKKEIYIQLGRFAKRDIIEQSLNDRGGIILAPNMDEAVALANEIAPEHLEIMTARPAAMLEHIHNAGSVFLGDYSPEPLGDYYAGPNHVLPTAGSARFFSPLSVDDFIKRMGVIMYSKDELGAAARDITRFAKAEGLGAHANAIGMRFSGE